ncbi:metal-dependent transcriptional regulator [Chloroflexus aurantiacus]
MVTTHLPLFLAQGTMRLAEPEATCLLALADLTESDELVFADQLVRCLHIEPEQLLQVLQHLFTRQLVTAAERGALTLTANGYLLARHLVMRHRLLERFLFDVVGVPWIFVHREAARLAPVISPLFLERVVELTRHATVCPHGNPIPGRSEVVTTEIRLPHAPMGQRCRLTRIAEWVGYESHLLQRLWSHELLPGRSFVRVPDPFQRYVIVVDQRVLVLGPRIANALFVVVE